MGPNLKKIIGVSAISLAVIAGSFGCAGPARSPANRPGPGPGATGGTAGTHAGLGNTGAPGGLTNAGWDARTLRTDWGQQISDLVAGMSALGPRGVTGAGATGLTGGPGAAGMDNAGFVGRGRVGVSTLLVGNVAFVGIDAATLNGTAGAGAAGATAAGLGGTSWTGGTALAGAGTGTMHSAPGIAASPWATDMTGVTSSGTGGPSGNVLGRGNGGIRAAYDEPPGGPIALFGAAGGGATAGGAGVMSAGVGGAGGTAGGMAVGAGTAHSAPGIAATPWATDTVGVDSAGTTGFSGNVFGRGNGGIRAAHDEPPGGPIPMGGAAVNLTAPSVGGAAAAPGLEAAVRDRVRTAFPQVAEVFVTTDPGLVSRIARLTGSMQAGTSISGQLSEVMAIASAMAGGTAGTTGITTSPAGTTGTTGTTGGTR